MQKVQIIPDETGNNIRMSKTNPTFGHVRVTQKRITFGTNNWVKKSELSTLIHGTIDDLKEAGFDEMTEISGKIVIKESLEPFTKNDPDRDLKIAGNTGIICCYHGQPIYRKTFFTHDVTAEDETITHTNGDAIREANANFAPNAISNDVFKEISSDLMGDEDPEPENNLDVIVDDDSSFELS
jgi:hypothetical protein